MSVSRLGLGLAALGRPGYININHGADLNQLQSPDEWETHVNTMLDAAWQAGINYFDVARSYGKGEKFLGDWLRDNKISEEKAVIGSKWGYTYTANWQVEAEQHEVKNHSLPQLDKQREESNLLLGAYLKVYYIHSATIESGVLDNKLVLERLHTLKSTGLIIGLSVSGSEQAETIKKALDICFDDHCLFQVVQATYNILETSAGPSLAEAHRRGLGVIVKEGMGNGRIISGSELGAGNAELTTTLANLSAKYNSTPDAVALAYILAQPWTDSVLSGAVNTTQLQQNIDALRITLSPEDVAQLQPFTEGNEQYWGKRRNLVWN